MQLSAQSTGVLKKAGLRFPVTVDGQIVEWKGAEVVVSPSQGRILAHILSTKHGKSLNEIIEAVYFDDPNCGPETAENTIYVLISQMRRKIQPLGLGINIRGRRYIVTEL